MTYFIKNENVFTPTDETSLHIEKKLPVGTYMIKFDMRGNPFFERVEDFAPLKKYYGDTILKAERIMNTYHDRKGTTGVLLSGEKGSGKTLLAKYISILGYQQEIPTILINTPFKGDLFADILRMIDQECILLLDEFEKVYTDEDQQHLLTILDGVATTKKMFIFTTNDRYRVNSHMQNRPGRIYYTLEYKGLSEEFIREYCEDNLKNKSKIDSICRISLLYRAFNFDMLQAIIEEMNRYDEDIQQVLKYLNATPESDYAKRNYNVKLFLPNHRGSYVEVEKEKLYTTTLHGTVMSLQSLAIYLLNDSNDEEEDDVVYLFRDGDMKSLSNSGEMTFINSEGVKVELIPERNESRSYYDLL